MDHGSTGIWARWRTAKRATRLHTVLLDVDELTERADNAIKFLSDMFSARLYKVAASKIGVTDYKDLVNQKVHTAEELYRFMVDQFHQSRAFVLELMVVIILIIDLIWLFKGSTADLGKLSAVSCQLSVKIKVKGQTTFKGSGRGRPLYTCRRKNARDSCESRALGFT